MKKSIFQHEIKLDDLIIRNAPREVFMKSLLAIPYSGYRVETISDGREIVITKPGGKEPFGTLKSEDFMVWIHDPANSSLWRISHNEIFKDIEDKLNKDLAEGKRVVEAFERVYSGEEPEDVCKSYNPTLNKLDGELPETLLKVYKWIWGQEDCNYPTKQGRAM